MAMPALRQPKSQAAVTENRRLNKIKNEQHVILSLRNGTKLVISSDAYNGILRMEDTIKCVYCDLSMEAKEVYKEVHVITDKHLQCMNSYCYIETFADHLMKQINKNEIYCIICNTIVSAPVVTRHIGSDVHMVELQKARTKLSAYEAK